MPELENEFHRAMLATYDQAEELGYRATYFLQMVQEHGGVKAAKRLLAQPEVQPGLTRLWELKRLDISMEALVLQEQFQPLFNETELADAHRRLDKLDYFKTLKR